MAESTDRTESIFFAAIAVSDLVERAALLDRQCGDDASLRARIDALLRAHDQAGHLLDRPTGLHSERKEKNSNLQETSAPIESKNVGGTTDCRGEIETGTMIDQRFTLRRKIGEGGMGEVWTAKQSEPVKRKVAIKLIKLGMNSKAVVARFEQERQALAMMDHPNIARVLDGGLTSAGQPYFVMELVNGLPLTKFCDEAKLSLPDRLELFLPICQAVQHAHQKGIIHRDLKPANILVTMIDGRPVPKVIDFGVAKATGGKLTEETMSTQFGTVVGTLEYMSPEQAGYSGDDIDTRADIYSLGVILYELLTGLRPIDGHRLRNAAITEMIRIIREVEPSKPSTRLSTDDSLPSVAAVRKIEPKKLASLLRGELDWVVMKCLEKSRDRRYETANALSRDIQRYLVDEPVEARPPSAGYRARKFLRRHRGPVVAASLLIIAIVAGTVGTGIGLVRTEAALKLAVEAQRAEAERADGERKAKLEAEKATDQARKRLTQIEKANEILGSIFESIDPDNYENADGSLREVLVEQLDRAVVQLDGDAIGDPLVVAEMQSKLARSLRGTWGTGQIASTA